MATVFLGVEIPGVERTTLERRPSLVGGREVESIQFDAYCDPELAKPVFQTWTYGTVGALDITAHDSTGSPVRYVGDAMYLDAVPFGQSDEKKRARLTWRTVRADVPAE